MWAQYYNSKMVVLPNILFIFLPQHLITINQVFLMRKGLEEAMISLQEMADNFFCWLATSG